MPLMIKVMDDQMLISIIILNILICFQVKMTTKEPSTAITIIPTLHNKI